MFVVRVSGDVNKRKRVLPAVVQLFLNHGELRGQWGVSGVDDEDDDDDYSNL